MNSLHRFKRGLQACALIALPALAAPLPAPLAVPFADPLDAPALHSAYASRSLVNGLAVAGTRLVAAGQRGHILYSDDQGQTWTQAAVPVSTDLLALQFPLPQLGWAVGHDGVVLHSADGGASWRRQLDGRAVPNGIDKPFLDVWFEDAAHGYAVGAFGLIRRTADGGQTWQAWEDHVDNPNGFHLNAIRAVGGELYIAGEQGLLLRLDRASGRFVALATPYRGSYFGLVGQGQALVLFGLRGNAWRSTDRGRGWTQVDTGLQVGLTAGAVTADGRMVLVSQAGQVLVSSDAGASFRRLPQPQPAPASAVVAAGAGQLAIGGMRGLRRQPLAAQ